MVLLVFGRAKWTSIKGEMGLFARKLGLKAVQDAKAEVVGDGAAVEIDTQFRQKNLVASPRPQSQPDCPRRAQYRSSKTSRRESFLKSAFCASGLRAITGLK